MAGTPEAEAREAIEGKDPARPSAPRAERPGEPRPAAGSHAEPDLVNPEATPGAGSLPPAGEHDGTDSTSG